MSKLQCPAIEQPLKTFLVRVLRAPCYNVIYRPERWETHEVLCETQVGALKVAKYHFYLSDKFELLGELPKNLLEHSVV